MLFLILVKPQRTNASKDVGCLSRYGVRLNLGLSGYPHVVVSRDAPNHCNRYTFKNRHFDFELK